MVLLREGGRWLKQFEPDNPELRRAVVALFRNDTASLDDAVRSLHDPNTRPFSPEYPPGYGSRHAGATLLHLAAESGQETALELLLRRGAPANAATDWSKTNFDSPDKSEFRETPLDWAVRTGRTRVAIILLQQEAAQRNVESNFDRVFQSALDGNWTEIAWDLLQADGQPNAGRMADWIDVAVQQADTAMLERALAEKGPQILVAARPKTVIRAAAQGSDGCIPLLLKGGADPNASADGQSALLAASAANGSGALQALLEFHAKVDEPGADGNTALFAAVRSGKLETTRLLLEAGANSNQPGPDDRTPLHEGVVLGQTALVSALLNHGARTDIADRRGQLPLELALLRRNRGVVDLLTRNGARLAVGGPDFPGALEQCLALDQLELIQRAAEDGWDVHARLHSDWPVSQAAAFFNAHETMTWLHEHGNDEAVTDVFSPDEVDRQPQPVAVNLGPEARFFYAPHLAQGVEITGVIDQNGSLLFAQVVRSPASQLTPFVESAMADWSFRPAVKDKRPVPMWARLIVTFEPDAKRKKGPRVSSVTFRAADLNTPTP